MWTTLEIAFIALGLLLAFAGDRFSLPVLVYVGIGFLGMALIVTGWQAIITRRLILGSRRRRRQTVTGVPAVFQGVQFNFAGLFLIAIAFLSYFNSGLEIFHQMVRRPGLLLVILGGLALLQAMIIFWGSQEAGQTSPGVTILLLVFARLFPGLIWLVLGLGLSVLGLIDALAPARFDELGGRFLEELYGLR